MPPDEVDAPVSARVCAHCGSPVPAGGVDYCCGGCRAVATVLRREGLAERFYALGGGRGAPAPGAGEARDHLWLEPIAAALAASDRPTTIALDAQGIHCSACVWAFEELFTRRPGALGIVVDPTLGRLSVDVAPGFDLGGYARDVEALGYVLGPPEKHAAPESTSLVWRTGIAIAVAMNVMSFSLAEYLGLSEEPLRSTLRALSVALTVVSVAIGAPPFLRGALAGLRAGVLTLDLPIALGMTLVTLATAHGWLRSGEVGFADTLAVFVALMLGGRLLEQRSLARARQRLLATGAVPRLWTRRAGARGLEVVAASEIGRDDRLVIAPGEVLPVDACLEGDRASIALDWVTGESEPVERAPGDEVAAGALNAGETPIEARALRPFDASSLRRLFDRPARTDGETPGLEAALSRIWTAGVLAVAAATWLGWGLVLGDWEGGLRATTAVLVVTCPCGIGIATPLARELARARLRGEGLIVRTARTLARATRIERVVFDKTGTLTTGRPEVTNASALHALPRADQSSIAAIVARSAHPRSGAVQRVLAHVPAAASVHVVEKQGQGLLAEVDGHVWRIGSSRWAGGGTGDVVVAKDGVVIADLVTDERLRDGAVEEIAALQARGVDVFVLSGDREERVLALAKRAGVGASHVIGGASPEDKATWLAARAPERTLFVGDGLNDLPAASVAALSGTPAIERPFLPARTDFHFTVAGLGPVRSLLDTAALVRAVAVRNALFALAYNVVAVGVAAAGAMPPWLAAVLMPLSSLVVVGSTVGSLAGGRRTRAHLGAAIRPGVAPAVSL